MATVITIQRADGSAEIRQTVSGAERVHFRYIAQEGDAIDVAAGEPELTPPVLGAGEAPGYLLVSQPDPPPAAE